MVGVNGDPQHRRVPGDASYITPQLIGLDVHPKLEEPDMSKTVDMKLEIVAIPVSDVDRAKRFYQGHLKV
jgi:hypothetical protein